MYGPMYYTYSMLVICQARVQLALHTSTVRTGASELVRLVAAIFACPWVVIMTLDFWKVNGKQTRARNISGHLDPVPCFQTAGRVQGYSAGTTTCDYRGYCTDHLVVDHTLRPLPRSEPGHLKIA